VARVLVTGGAGFIGRHVVAALLAGGQRVRVLDNLDPGVHPNPPVLPEAAELVVADVRDPDAVRAALADVDTVVHLAAKVGLGVSLADMTGYADTNDVGTATVLVAMGQAEISRLVLASSMVVYGEGRYRCPEHGTVGPGIRRRADLDAGRFEPPCPVCGRELAPELTGEDAPLDPRNSYAVSKLAQEGYAATWAHATGGTARAMRFHNVYGPGMPIDTPYAGVAAVFRSMLRAGRAPQVHEDGGQRRDFVHVRDVAAAVVAAVVAGSPDVDPVPARDAGAFRAYNVGSGRITTVGELAAGLAEAMRGPAPVVTGQYRDGDVRHITASSARLVAELGWEPRIPLADGLSGFAADDRAGFAADDSAGFAEDGSAR